MLFHDIMRFTLIYFRFLFFFFSLQFLGVVAHLPHSVYLQLTHAYKYTKQLLSVIVVATWR